MYFNIPIAAMLVVSFYLGCNSSKDWCCMFSFFYLSFCFQLKSEDEYKFDCALYGGSLKWVSSCRYLGVFLISARSFKCSFDQEKAKYFRAFNSIYGKVSCSTTEDIIITLLKTKCLPVILYATEACPILSRDMQSLEFAVTRSFMKIFHSGSSWVIAECQKNFNFVRIKHQIAIRTAKFLRAFSASENIVCSVFCRHATSQLNGLFSSYGEQIHTVSQLIDVVCDLSDFQ